MRTMASSRTGVANRQLYDLSAHIIDTHVAEHEHIIAPGSAETGGMLPYTAAGIIESKARTRGFLRAIRRALQAQTAIDAGCGPTAVLSLGLAAFHPKAEIFAYEVTETSARCARVMVELMGLDDRITVLTDNVLTTNLPRVNLAVTETFSEGLGLEKGARIAHRLSTVADNIIPTKAIIHARAGGHPSQYPWQQAGIVDFREGGDRVSGSFAATVAGDKDIRVYAEYVDAANLPVVTGYASDAITTDMSIGRVQVPHAGSQVHFTYPTGHFATPEVSSLWVTP